MHHGALVRLSVNLDPSLYESLRARAYAERSTISAVLNRLAKEALEGAVPQSELSPGKPSRFPVSAGQPGKTLTQEMLAKAEDEAESPRSPHG